MEEKARTPEKTETPTAIGTSVISKTESAKKQQQMWWQQQRRWERKQVCLKERDTNISRNIGNSKDESS
jgi:hypothetical protein